MKPDLFLNTRSYIFFALFAGATVVAFWPSYFSVLSRQPHFFNHAHGISMMMWVILLILQPFLIFLKYKALHAAIGKLSYALVPIIVVSIILLLRKNMGGMKIADDFSFSFVALVVNAAMAFVLLFSLAIANRKRSDIHARYMICTVFPMMTPVTDRLIAHHLRPLIAYAPQIADTPVLPFFGFIFSDLLLLLLLIWDWRSNKRLDVFPLAFLIVLLFQVSVFSFYRFDWWKDFSIWILN